MIADLWVYELGDTILISTAREVKPTVLARLDQFVFTEDVQLGDVSETFAALAAVGPQSAQAVSSVISGASAERLSALPEHGNVRAEFRGQPAIVLRATDTGQAGFDVLVAAPELEALKAALYAEGAVDVDAATAEALRIEAGIPKFHRDMDEETIPLEAGIEGRAISLTKGCYVGQEVIIRVLHRGHGRVARKLVGLTLDQSAVPPAGATVTADARDVGAITSSAFSPALQKAIALAYVHRDFVAPGTMLTAGGQPAMVTALPFVGRET
jgi:folate-binding protein YgfZ